MRRAVSTLCAAVALLLVALAGCSSPEADVPDATVIAVADRQPAPAVTGELLDGGTFDLAQHKGDVVVVNFWGSWCGPCVAESAAFEATYVAVKDSGVTFVGVNVRDTSGAAKEFAAARLTYPSIFDPAGKVALGFTVPPSTPSTYIVDRQGRIAFVARHPLARTDLEPAVTQLAAESVVSGLPGVAANGPLIAAIAVAALAGLVSFLSPCVLPLVPGYLSYVTGLAGADLDDALQRPDTRARGRILLGTAGFVAGFTAVFIVTSLVVTGLGRALLMHTDVVRIVSGVLIIGLGLAFLGLIPGLQYEWRLHRLPTAGLASAPVLGAVFALGWAPCVGPTFAAVLALGQVSGTAGRAVALTIAYCLGLGLPFLAFGLGFRKLIGVFKAVRRNSVWVTRVGGGLLILVGLGLVTGFWDLFLNWLRASAGAGGVGI